MASDKILHFRRVRLAGRGVRPRGEQLLIEALGVFDDEHRYVDHGHPPLLAIGWAEAEGHTAHRRGAVGHVGLAAGERESADHRDASGSEDHGLGEAHSLAIAVEVTSNANALGVVAAETGPNTIDLLEGVG